MDWSLLNDEVLSDEFHMHKGYLKVNIKSEHM